MRTILAKTCTRFIQGYLYQPRAEFGVSTETPQTLQGFQEGFLCDLFSVSSIVQDRIGDGEDHALIGLDQRIKQVRPSLANLADQLAFAARRFEVFRHGPNVFPQLNVHCKRWVPWEEF